MSAFRTLHLSDIHIGKTYINSKEIAFKIISDLEHNGLCSIKCVLVTGDIFDGQVTVNEKLIKEANLFFGTILEQVNLIQEEHKLSKNDFIFVPGNHDIIRVDNYEDRWKKYNDFLIGFYGIVPDFYNVENHTVIRSYDDERIVFVGFNSCQIEKKVVFDKTCILNIQKIDSSKMDKLGLNKDHVINLFQNEVSNEYVDYGEIPMSQIADVSRKIKKLDSYNVVALFHHHFYLFPEVVREYGDSSLVRNYANLIQQLKYMNVKTVLHGHKHFDLERPLITDEYYQTTDSIIDVFAGGSVGTDRKDKHTFSVIDFYDHKDEVKLIQNKFIYNGESLEPIINKQIPPKNLSDRKIKLIEILKSNNYDTYCNYESAVEKIFKTYKTCGEIIKWTDEVLTGFQDVYRFLDNDHRNILFLLYAINYRTLSYKNIMEKGQNLQSFFEILKDLFDKCLKSNDLDIDVDDFHNIFKIKKLEMLKISCDKLMNKSLNKKTKQYLAFTMIGIFFTDLYLVLTEYADDFYNESIKYKVNINLEQNKFHQDVPVPRIEIKSDSDRRSVYIQLLCNEATAHKIAVLFIKEFDILINKYEDYFKMIGLKLYYLLPKIENNKFKDTINNYNFEAYIPTLLPLLTGDNIYPSKEVFARELIQNSIDAIAVREAKDTRTEFDKTINIEIGNDENNRFYFKIKDCGTGMDRFKIERYFTSIGRSFYSGDDYDELKIDYKPISNFGIGFLSSFMVCKEIDVKTKSFMPESEGLKLHIPNYDGCFFIEREDEINVGTEIKLYLNEGINATDIVDYIKVVMQDIKYDIIIVNNLDRILIPAYSIRKKDAHNFNFFIPFKENGDILNIDWEDEVKTENYINKYEYGMLIKSTNSHEPLNQEDKMQGVVLNSGILVRKSSLFDILINNKKRSSFQFFDKPSSNIFANFPANWIQIDVSREISTSFADIINNINNRNPQNTIRDLIAESLFQQLLSCLKYSKNNKIFKNSAIFIQEILNFINLLSNRKNIKLQLADISYTLFIRSQIMQSFI